MAATDFIVAIELGSTEITGIAGKKNADGRIRILAYASERSSDCIKKGAIYNLDKTTQCLTSVIKELEETLHAPIRKVYVGIGGLSVRSIRNTESKQLGEDTKISQALIDSIMQSNREIPLIDREILAVEPQEYKVGNNLLTEPVGVPADYIEGHFLNIIARHSLKSNIKQCFKQTGYEVADYFLSPLVTANVVLSDSERRSGCALIDFGANTTTVSVYKNNILRHLAVIPLGSENITQDICSMHFEEEEGEQLKLRFGSAYTELSDNDEETNRSYNLDGRCTIPARQLEDIVEARVNEIITNVWNQIMVSGYGDKLLGGVVFTGGMTNLPNLDKAFTHITKIEKIRIAKSSEISLEGDIELPQDGTQNTLIGILASGKENCCRIDPRKGVQLSFTEDLQQKEAEAKRKEEERKLKEEEERRQAEEAERRHRIEEEKKRQEEERAMKRQKEYESYMERAQSLLGKKNYKAALQEIEHARAMNLPEKAEEINVLEDEIKAQKKKNSWFSNLTEKITKMSDDIMKD